MTYTFKLARRLAGLPHFGMLALLLTCGLRGRYHGSPRGRSWLGRNDFGGQHQPRDSHSPKSMRRPGSAAASTHPLARASAPRSPGPATGGTIDSTGSHLAGAAVGTYSVVATNAGRDYRGYCPRDHRRGGYDAGIRRAGS